MPHAPPPPPNGMTNFHHAGSLEQFRPEQSNHIYNQEAAGGWSTIGSGGKGNTAEKLIAMEPFFGAPQRQAVEKPYSWWDSENYDLPDGLRGRCTYVLNILITAILTSDMWPVTEMLPYKKNEGGLKIEWDQWVFNDSLLDRTPEQTPSRMVTNNFASFSAHLVRRGKAFMLEHGFWRTPMGQKNWAMNIVQIVNATNETACFNATHAILTAAPYVDPHQRFRRVQDRSIESVADSYRQQTSMFAICQKQVNGFDFAVQMAVATHENRNGHKPNMLVYPQTCAAIVRDRPEENAAWYNGIGATNRNIANEGGFRARHSSRGYRVGEHMPNWDPHYMTVTVGGFFVWNMYAAKRVPIKEYRTMHRDIKVFSMPNDNYVQLEFGHHVRYTGLYQEWNSAVPVLSWIGAKFFAKYSSLGVLCQAAGVKVDVIEKVLSMEEGPYQDFMNFFGVDPKNELHFKRFRQSKLLMPGQPVGLEDQPVTAGTITIVDVDKSKAMKDAFSVQVERQSSDSKWAKRRKTSLAFSGNLVVPWVELNPRASGNRRFVDIVLPGPEYAHRYYRLATAYFVLFDVKTPNMNGNKNGAFSLKLVDDFGHMTVHDISSEERLLCQRAVVSVTVSVLVSLIKSYNKDGNGTTNVDAYAAWFSQWLNHTVGPWDHTSTDSVAVAEVFRDDAWIKGYCNSTKQAPLQRSTPFQELIGIIAEMCQTQASGLTKLFRDAVIAAAVDQLGAGPGDQQPSAKGRGGSMVESLEARRRFVYTIYKDDSKDGVISDDELRKLDARCLEQVKSLRSTTEAKINTHATAEKMTADQKTAVLQGFHMRWSAFIQRFVREIWYWVDQTPISIEVGDNKKITLTRHKSSILNGKSPDDITKWLLCVISVAAHLTKTAAASSFLQGCVQFVSHSLSNSSELFTPLMDLSESTFKDPHQGDVLTNAIVSYQEEREMAGPNEVQKLIQKPEDIQAMTASPNTGTTELDRFKVSVETTQATMNKLNEIVRNRDTKKVLLGCDMMIKALTEKVNKSESIDEVRAYVQSTCSDIGHQLTLDDTQFILVYMAMFLNGSKFGSIQFNVNSEENDFPKSLAVVLLLMNQRSWELLYFDLVAVAVACSVDNLIPGSLTPSQVESAMNQVKSRLNDAKANNLLQVVFKGLSGKEFKELVSAANDSLPKSLRSNLFGSRSQPKPNQPDQRVASASKGLVSTQFSAYRRANYQEMSEILDALTLTNGRWLKYFCDHDIPNPLGMIGWRLHKMYEMGTGFVMDAFGDAGYTYFGFADFQLGDDIGKKVHVAHFTLYLKALVQYNKLIVYMRHIISRAYLGGDGTRCWNPLDKDDTTAFRHDAGGHSKDVIVAPVLANFKPKHIMMDVTGRFSDITGASQDASSNTEYESSSLIQQIWGVRHPPQSAEKQIRAAGGHVDTKTIFQTTAMQEATFTWNHKTGDFTDYTEDSTHWGPRVVPGCGRVRRGEASYIERANTIGIGL